MVRFCVAVLAIVVLILTAGCTTVLPDDDAAAVTGDGEIAAEVVTEAPPNATVVAYADSRVQANSYLRKAVRRAVNKSGRAVVTVPKIEVEKMKEDRARLPGYFPKNSSSSEYESGYYIEYNQTVVHVEFAILD